MTSTSESTLQSTKLTTSIPETNRPLELVSDVISETNEIQTTSDEFYFRPFSYRSSIDEVWNKKESKINKLMCLHLF